MQTDRSSMLTDKARSGADRFAELLAEYRRMKGPEGDQLHSATHELYTGILADALHYASLTGVNYVLAFSEAYRIHLEESAEG